MKVFQLFLLSFVSIINTSVSAQTTNVAIDGIKYKLDTSSHTATPESSCYTSPGNTTEDHNLYVVQFYSNYSGDFVLPSTVKYNNQTYFVTYSGGGGISLSSTTGCHQLGSSGCGFFGKVYMYTSSSARAIYGKIKSYTVSSVTFPCTTVSGEDLASPFFDCCDELEHIKFNTYNYISFKDKTVNYTYMKNVYGDYGTASFNTRPPSGTIIHVFPQMFDIYKQSSYWADYKINGDILDFPIINCNSDDTYTLPIYAQIINWVSSDPSIVSITSSGTFTAHKQGIAKITATDENGVDYDWIINVDNSDFVATEGISLNKYQATIQESQTLQLFASITPSNVTFKDIKWKSSDPTIAIVDGNGLVTALTPGHVIITASSSDSYAKINASCELTIIHDNLITYTNGTTAVPSLFYGSSLNLTDGDISSLKIGKTVENVNVTYNRTFTTDCWQGWYVPFDMKVTSDMLSDFIFGEIYDIQITNSEALENATIELVRMQTGDILCANTPYLIRPKTTGNKVFTAEGTTVYATPTTELEASIDCSTTKDIYIFTGVYEPTFMLEKNGYYLATDGGFNYTTKATTKIGAFRYYMTILNRKTGEFYYPGASANAPERINLVEVDEATLINAIRENAEGTAEMFNLQGMKVGKDYKGIVIINGKKRLIK